MRTGTLILIIISGLICTSLSQSDDYSEDEKIFGEYFQLADTLRLDFPGLVIGEISSLLQLDSDIFVIYDNIAQQLVVVNFKTNKFSKVDIEEAIPGMKLMILSIFKDPKKGFWFANSPNIYVHVDENGKIVEYYYLKNHTCSDKSIIDKQSNIISYTKKSPENQFLIRFNPKNGSVKKLFIFDFPKNLAVRIYRSTGGGMIMDQQGYLYFANTFENKILKIDSAGRLVKTFISKNRNFKINDEPLENTIEAVMQSIGKPMDGVVSLHLLNPETMIAHYTVNYKPNFELFSTQGEVINRKILKNDMWFLYANNNHLFFSSRPNHHEEQGDLANPIIIRYRYKLAK
ncbi:MAG: hypothetical protein KBA26_11710 [Candidatus Delongbacteria bacterium]|nr:hypothetical protein [Candidatus Delongbacteria bacterium]